MIENADIDSDEVYHMSGETGSLRYMAPEVAEGLPYNHTADVYSFGIILWELNATKKPYEGLNRELFYERIVHGGERPPLSKKWPIELTSLMSECWDTDMFNRPKFRDIVRRLDKLIIKERGGDTFGPTTATSTSAANTTNNNTPSPRTSMLAAALTGSGGGDHHYNQQQNQQQTNNRSKENTATTSRKARFLPRLSGMIDRHSSWF